MGLLNSGFELPAAEKAQLPEERMEIPGMTDELRCPMMLPVKAKRRHKKSPLPVFLRTARTLYLCDGSRSAARRIVTLFVSAWRWRIGRENVAA